MALGGEREGQKERRLLVFLSLLKSLYLAEVSISHLNQVLGPPSVVNRLPRQPWQPWATEQREPSVGRLSFSLPLPVFLGLSARLSLHLLSSSSPSAFSARNAQGDVFTLFLAHLPSCVRPRVYTRLSVFRCSPVCQETRVVGSLAVPPLMLSAELLNISKLGAGVFASLR